MNKLKIYQTIRERILFLEYPPGEILKENILAKEFGISRTPLRDILSRLEWEKLVTIIPRGGAMVTAIEFQKLGYVYQIRVYIEGLIAKLAAEKITDDQIRELKNIRKEYEKLSRNRTPKDLINLDLRFREVLSCAAGNPILKEISDYLYNMMLRVWVLIFDQVDWSEEVRLSTEEMDELLAAFIKRDTKKAEKSRRDFIILWADLIAWSHSIGYNPSDSPTFSKSDRLNELLRKRREGPGIS